MACLLLCNKLPSNWVALNTILDLPSFWGPGASGAACLDPLGQGLSQAVLSSQGSAGKDRGFRLVYGSQAGLSSLWAIGSRPHELLDSGFPQFLVMRASPPGISWHGSLGSGGREREKEKERNRGRGGGERTGPGVTACCKSHLGSGDNILCPNRWFTNFKLQNSPGPEILIWQSKVHLVAKSEPRILRVFIPQFSLHIFTTKYEWTDLVGLPRSTQKVKVERVVVQSCLWLF